MHTRILAPLCLAALLSACAPPTTHSAPPAAATGEAATTAASNSTPCALKADAWADCIGQSVDIGGRYPITLAQHPLLAPPAMSGSPPVTQTYLETADGRQIIVLTADRIPECPAAMRVRGTLQAVDLGGPDGTPQSYRGWAVHGASVSCE